MRWTVLLALVGLVAGSPLAAASPLAAGEPAPAAQAPSLDAFLPAHWQKQASAQALADLSALAGRYAGPVPALRLDVPQLRRLAACRT